MAIDLDDAGRDSHVRGRVERLPHGPLTIDCRSAATVARFLTPVLATAAGPFVVDGSTQLRERPMEPVLAALTQLGARVTMSGHHGHLPVEIAGPVRGGGVRVRADLSSQFVSGLLLAGSLMPDGLQIKTTTPMVAEPFVAMTRSVMATFGVVADGLTVARQRFQPTEFEVEPDASAASYFFTAAAITGGRVIVRGIYRTSVQGDAGFVDALAAMGATVGEADDGIEVRGSGALYGGEFDLSAMPDMAPTLAVAAVFADADTTVRGIGFVRHHETDRLAAIVTELRRCGVRAEELDDGFVVHPGHVQPARIETYGDHRMAMAFSLLGLRVPGIEIAGAECVAKTFPGFFVGLDALRQ